jgi:predicted molibdopterin-dependent oxidoreductase YjgC
MACVTVDGQPLCGVAGEPLAALLLAHGIGVMRQMPASGAPRGLFCGVGRCADCLMTVDGELNVRVCVTAARDGMQVHTQHGLGAWEAEH